MRQTSQPSSHMKLLLGLLSLGLVFGCDGKEKPPPSTAQANESTGDDDYVVVAPVPMNLLSAEDWKRIKEQLAQSLAKTSKPGSCLDTKADFARSGVDLWSEAHLRTVADHVVAAPCYAAGNLAEIAAQIETTQQSLFSPSGLLGREPIKVGLKQGQTSNTKYFRFATPQDRYNFAGVTFSQIGSYPYQVLLYGAPNGDQVPLLAQISFKLNEDQTQLREALLLYRSSGTQTFWLEATFNAVSKGLVASYGPTQVSDQVPARNWLQLDVLSADEIQISGGYIWDLNLGKIPENALSPPRFEWLQKGDIELFQARSLLSGQREMVQQHAFLATSDRIQLGDSAFEQGQSFFNDRIYQSLLEQHVEEVVRRVDVNTGCASFGNTLKALFTAGSEPTSVAAAPANFCRSNSSLAMTDVINVLNDVCAAGKTVTISISTTSGNIDYAVCPRLNSAVELGDMVFTSLADPAGLRTKVAQAQATANHTKLADELRNTAFPSFKDLVKSTPPTFADRTVSDLAAAIELK